MRFIQEFGFTVKLGQEEAFQKWMAQNEEALRKAHPEGIEYLGTYAVVFSTDKQGGGYRIVVAFENYADMDRMAAGMKDAKSDFGRLVRESSRFGNFDHDAPWSQALLKRVVDATIWDAPGT
jgi:hypothetical protein